MPSGFVRDFCMCYEYNLQAVGYWALLRAYSRKTRRLKQKAEAYNPLDREVRLCLLYGLLMIVLLVICV